MTADGSMVLRRLLLLTLPMRLALLVAWSTSPATAVKDVHSENDCRCWAAQGACASNGKFMVSKKAASCERHQACEGLFEAGGPSILEERKARIIELEDQLARGSGEQQQQLQQKDTRISQLGEEFTKSVGKQEEHESVLALAQAAVEECQANLSSTHATAKGADDSERAATLERALEQTEAKNKELEVSLGEAKKQAAGASTCFAQLEAVAQGTEKLKRTEAVAKEREEQHQQELSKTMADAASAEARAAELEAERERPLCEALKVELSEHKQLVETLRRSEAVVPGGTEQATLECWNAKQACEDKTQVLEAQERAHKIRRTQ